MPESKEYKDTEEKYLKCVRKRNYEYMRGLITRETWVGYLCQYACALDNTESIVWFIEGDI